MAQSVRQFLQECMSVLLQDQEPPRNLWHAPVPNSEIEREKAAAATILPIFLPIPRSQKEQHRAYH